jgi:hypothetical protein
MFIKVSINVSVKFDMEYVKGAPFSVIHISCHSRGRKEYLPLPEAYGKNFMTMKA